MKQLMKKNFFIGLLVMGIIVFSVIFLTGSNVSITIISPYEGIDWRSYGQYKTALHVHTRNSDGRNTLSEMLEDHYKKNYDIVAITDHNYLTEDWVSASNGLTMERFEEITSGTDRGGRGMLQIPFTDEQSMDEHLNTFFTNYNNITGSTIKSSISTAQEIGGISHINHPGRYTGGQAGGITGKNASNDEQVIKKYVDLFMQFPSCAGMEIINKKDGESASDRILWDNILSRTVPKGRFVWGFSNDDTHQAIDTGFSFNVFIMKENTAGNFRTAMQTGNFYAVARISKRELSENFPFEGPVPVITGIVTDNKAASITINAENFYKIDWISKGKVIASGNIIKLNKYKNKAGPYVRANITGPGGIVFVQPFGIKF